MFKFHNKKILISGSSSGLGKFLSNNLQCTKYDRSKKYDFYNKKKWDLIIHCGFYSGNDDINKSFESIYHSYCLSQLRSKKYIFLSSTIVYENNKQNKESSNLLISHNNSYYSKAKIISEKFFDPQKTLILRLGTIIGRNMKKNSIYKILFMRKEKIGLSGKSINSYVSYIEILDFIIKSQKEKIYGIFNVLRTDYQKLSTIKKIFKSDIKFGNFVFKCINADNKKIQKYINLRKESSIDVLKKILYEK